MNYACEKKIIENGIDINSKTKYNNKTALSISIRRRNNRELIKLLLMNDANIFDLDQYQITKELIEIFFQIYSINQDLNNLLLKSNEDNNFSDYQIQSNDGFKFNVHKLILLTRFDNNQIILNKFINICQLKKTKEEVELSLNFLYSGFYDFEQIYQKLNLEHFKDQSKQTLLSEMKEKENKITKLFKEIGFDSNWIENKKGRKGIIKDLSKLYQQNETKDFTIIISKEKEIKVHKLILIIQEVNYIKECF
ncbi:hypothetical protein M0811_11688 [Anaeramoeba ignava]|uniref:Ankyrin repeat protein n=1 Tax=Anaeramoeba ignava TaxID=1746090 RepID=A0A9Q0LCE0_ANAIG|nr:hypothetical protein M0811_11688 [Anaeramoeba ignava]